MPACYDADSGSDKRMKVIQVQRGIMIFIMLAQDNFGLCLVTKTEKKDDRMSKEENLLARNINLLTNLTTTSDGRCRFWNP